MDYKEKYEKAVQAAMLAKQDTESAVIVQTLEEIFPELRGSEDERIRKQLLKHLREAASGKSLELSTTDYERWATWVAKQGGITKLSDEEQNKFAKGVLTSCALSFIDYLDAHKYEDKMCVSNGECEDIENAFHNAMWDRLHRYYCKYIEKQGEQKPDEEYNITGIHSKHAEGKLGEMIKNLKPVNEALEKETPESWNEFLEGEQKPADKIEQKPQRMVSAEAKEAMYDKPAWSEEDEMMLEGTIDKISDLGTGEMCKDWLKSLRPQTTWKPSDESFNNTSCTYLSKEEAESKVWKQ